MHFLEFLSGKGLLEEGFDCLSHRRGSANEELSLLLDQDLSDLVLMLRKQVLHVGLRGVWFSRKGQVELRNDLFVLHRCHLIAVDKVVVVLAAAKVEVGRA